ncbi:uncharacterized protein C2845_PM01G32790 [Panicum miliaceum]|uniref:Uncharacterized protein n=1 Tax=Panicum miliaceum TaxID=4540 RepID=A0A3L6TG31_PANMI|nr:uncharacterized protein C2845_PM01G32790 [Panicum miliaceum]
MQQQMAGLVRQVTGLSPRPRAADGSSGPNGQHRVVVRTGRARPGRVVAAAHVAARPRYCRLRVAASAIAFPDTSNQLLEQQLVRPGNTALNQLISYYHHQEGQVLRGRDEGPGRRARRVWRRQQRHLRQLPPQRSCRVAREARLQRGLLDIHGRLGSVRVEPQVLRTFEEWRQVRCQGEACANQRRTNHRRAYDRDPAGS